MLCLRVWSANVVSVTMKKQVINFLKSRTLQIAFVKKIKVDGTLRMFAIVRYRIICLQFAVRIHKF